MARPLPDEDLMWRVTSERDPVHFETSGRRSVEDLTRALSVVGAKLTDFKTVLDFGCGCGRIMRWLDELPPTVELHGVDVDAQAISWAAKHIPFARFSVNKALPPLEFPDGYFDLVFNHSVFSHLPEDYQDAWLAELNRVTSPKGLLLLSVGGELPFAGFLKTWREHGASTETYERLYRKHGIVYIAHDGWEGGPFPDFYHTAFHAPWYIFEHWGRFLDLKAYILRGALDFQDLLVLRPKAGKPRHGERSTRPHEGGRGALVSLLRRAVGWRTTGS